MAKQRMEGEEEALFGTYTFHHPSPYPPYFVQSPSTTVSRANSTTPTHPPPPPPPPPHLLYQTSFTFHNPNNVNPNHLEQEDQVALSRYSSSRESNNSFLIHHNNKIIIPYDDDDTDRHSHGTGQLIIIGDHHKKKRLIRGGDLENDDDEEEDDDDDEYDYYGEKRRSSDQYWWRYLSFRRSSSLGWICLQVSWRLMLSLGIALLVFYLATKPPPPQISIKMVGVPQFGLGEGVDASGVTTKILTCNCSMDLVIDNKSKVFGLHIHPPLLDLSFGNLPLTTLSYGPGLYAETGGSTTFKLYVGIRNKPMYGAGRAMQDLLDQSRAGEGSLPLLVGVRFSSSFRVVWDVIKPKFHHHAHCLLFLGSTYDKRHKTQAFNSTCTTI